MLELYHNINSVCAQKVRVALAEKGLAYQEHLIDLRGGQFDPAYMKLNPNAAVPTLVHEGRPVAGWKRVFARRCRGDSVCSQARSPEAQQALQYGCNRLVRTHARAALGEEGNARSHDGAGPRAFRETCSGSLDQSQNAPGG